MSPTAEQLIRDYLNQVSVAARTRLQSDDRRAFLARTRFAIEQQCGAPGTADPVEVADVLAASVTPRNLPRPSAPGSRRTAPRWPPPVIPGGPAARLGRPQGSPQRRRRIRRPRLRVRQRSARLCSRFRAGRRRPRPSVTGRLPARSRDKAGRLRRAGARARPCSRAEAAQQPKQPRRLWVARGGKGQSTAADDSAGRSGAAAPEPDTGPGGGGRAGRGR